MPPGSLDNEDVNYQVIPGDWRNGEEMVRMRPTTAKNPLKIAKDTRQKLTDHFMSDAGAVPWQYAMTETSVDRILGGLWEILYMETTNKHLVFWICIINFESIKHGEQWHRFKILQQRFSIIILLLLMKLHNFPRITI